MGGSGRGQKPPPARADLRVCLLLERVEYLRAEEAATPTAGMAVVCDRVALDELPEAAATLPEEG